MTYRSTAGRITSALSAALLVWSCSNEYNVGLTGSGRDRVDSLQSGGSTRIYALHLPLDYETVESPVVILFHGIGAIGASLQYISSFDIDADQHGFLAVYPNAITDWASGCGCTNADSAGVDDIQFVADLLDELDADYGINRDSVFVAGYSEGAFMAQKVACEATGLIAGMATVAGTMFSEVAEDCSPTEAVPVLMMHGTDDDDYPWEGALDRGLASVLAADTAAQFWATANGCGAPLDTTYVMTDPFYRFDVFRRDFDACPESGEVILYMLDGAPHGWPDGDFNASFQIADFFAGSSSASSAPAYLPRE